MNIHNIIKEEYEKLLQEDEYRNIGFLGGDRSSSDPDQAGGKWSVIPTHPKTGAQTGAPPTLGKGMYDKTKGFESAAEALGDEFPAARDAVESAIEGGADLYGRGKDWASKGQNWLDLAGKIALTPAFYQATSPYLNRLVDTGSRAVGNIADTVAQYGKKASGYIDKYGPAVAKALKVRESVARQIMEEEYRILLKEISDSGIY